MDNTKPSSKKIIVISIIVLLVAIMGVLVGLFVFGRLAITWKQQKQQVILLNRVCGDDVVESYNKVMIFQKQSNSEVYAIDEKGLNNLVTEVKNKQSYQNDATCQTILLAAAVQMNDYNAAKEALAAVKALHEKHIYADSVLNTGGSLSAYEDFVQELAPDNQDSKTQEPQGGA